MNQGKKTNARGIKNEQHSPTSLINNLRQRLRDYNFNANSVIDNYGSQRRLYLDINLTITIVFATIMNTFYEILPLSLQSYWLSGLTGCIFILILNVTYNSLEHRTFKKSLEKKNKWTTNWFYRGNIPERNELKKGIIEDNLLNKLTEFYGKFGVKSNKLDLDNLKNIESQFLMDDIRNLYKLYIYQSNYYKIAIFTRRLSLAEIIWVSTFGILLLVLFYDNRLSVVIIITHITISALIFYCLIKHERSKNKDKQVSPTDLVGK